MSWLSDHFLTVVFVVIGFAAVAYCYLRGWLGPALAIGLAVIVTFIFGQGKRAGREDSQAQGRRDAERTVRRADEARIDAQRRDADPERLRDDDGFRRD